MVSNWFIIAPILPAIVIFLSPILIERKKRIMLILSGTLVVFNLSIVIFMINSFRRDYAINPYFFPLNNFVLYLVIFNVIFLLYSLFFLIKFNKLKDTRFTRKISSFIYIIRDNLFKLDKRIDRIISLIMIFVLFYIVGFLSLFTHEFGHAMVNIIFNKYFERIELTINLQGLTYGAGSVILNTTQKTIAYLAGMISETLFALTVLIILLIKKEKNKFTWFLSITISMLFLNRVALYFTFSQLLGIPSDTFDMVINLGYDPWILFLIFLPYLMITFEITFQMMKKFSKNALRGEKDFLSVFVLGLISYIVFLIIFTPADPFSTQNFIYIFY